MSYKPQKSALITDLDNTLFDWFDIWSATFIPLLDKTVEISGIPRQQLISEIQPIHEKHGTAEYTFLLQEIPSLLKMYGSPEKIMEVLDPAIHASRSSRLKHMKLYDGVFDTLSELKSRGIRVIAYTESKKWYTQYRLNRMGLDHLIDHVYSPEDHDINPIRDGELTTIEFEHTQFSYTPHGEIKPNPALLLSIIKEQGLYKEECVYIGDSEIKDIDMAKNAGVTCIFAKYGTNHFSDERIKHYELLRQVTHWSPEMVKAEQELKENALHHHADYSIDSFAEILDIIDFKKQ